MNILSKVGTQAADSIAEIGDLADLSRFTQPSCAAAIWRRQFTPEVQDWIHCLDPERLPRGRVILQPSTVAETVEALCNAAETPHGPERDLLVHDIATLGDAFSAMLGVGWLRLRLDVVTTNACRRFHIDAVHARLVCTYRGTGTQYGFSEDGEDPREVFTVPTGAPVLLRGTLWPEQPLSGLRHRSPPIEGTGETRLVLVLDPIFDPEDAE